MKTFQLLKRKLFAKKKTSSERLERNRVRNAIETMAQTYLTDFDSVLTFEVLPKYLDSALIVIEESDLRSRYDIVQCDDTLFKMCLKDLGLL